MEEKNLFMIALKEHYRWQFRGQISVEDLWDLSVENLDQIYKALREEERKTNEESLLQVKSIKAEVLSNKIEIVRQIVKDKLAQIEKAKKSHENRQKRQQLLEIINQKQSTELLSKSIEELTAMVQALED